MAKRKTKARRSLAALPKGLPQRKRGVDVNPFEASSRQKRPKHEVHNRNTTTQQNPQSALAKSLQRRQKQLKESMRTSKKANAFVDRRIGEYDMTPEQQMLARLVRERSRRSKRVSKYSLEDDDQEPLLTHKGRAIDDFTAKDHVILSDDEEEGNLDAVDTEMHFGGGSFGEANAYGPGTDATNMANAYSQRKTELDDLIVRRKIMKAERVKSKQDQEDTFENMDESFKEIASMLQFRDKQQERKQREEARRTGTLTEDDKDMAEWDKEMKEYLFERKVKATDRTKTPEEKAKEEAERLHELETRRLARMNGDFEADDFSDISDDEMKGKTGKKKKRPKGRKGKARNPDELDDSEDEDEQKGLDVRFTADGLVYVDNDGNVVKKVGDEEENSDEDAGDSADSDSEDGCSSESEDEAGEGHYDAGTILSVGTKIMGKYRAKDQFDEQATWYDGVITKVKQDVTGGVTYDVTYDDGDFEEDVEPENVREIEKTAEEHEKEEGELATKRKRQKAKDRARQEIPFVFEVPTTLEALHDMIGNYASTGEDASLIIHRIHKANSVRLNKNNTEKMQNFYDVLLRRFVAVGDAIHSSGDGGSDLGRYKQLDELTRTLYAMSQDSPDCAGAVWGRRLGIFQNAHAKRLRDAELVLMEDDDDKFSAWPSTGTILLLRAVGHIFPTTDLRHHVVTPTILLLGQMVAQTPVRSIDDIVMGVLCSGLMIEFTKDANRIAPEALAFLAGALRLFAVDPGAGKFPMPSLEAAADMLPSLRTAVSKLPAFNSTPQLSLHKEDIDDETTPAAVLCSMLHLVEATATKLKDSLDDGEAEAFAEISESLLALKPKSKKCPLPEFVAVRVGKAAAAVSVTCTQERTPLLRRSGPTVTEMSIKSLAPRMEDPTRYSMSKDKGKSGVQAAIDRTRREYKREHKAVARELRLDAAFIESERRKEKDSKDSKARSKRQKNFAWLEGEQATMNQQVRLGGGLLSGGGTGAARAKAKSAKLGIKKGGKF